MPDPHKDLQNLIADIKTRNKRVELEKAWETSFTRRIMIVVLTYIIAGIWLVLIEDSKPWLKALVPVAGYVLSTLSLAGMRHFWKNRVGSN